MANDQPTESLAGDALPTPPLPSRPAGRFELVRLHAIGGLSEVYLARDTELNREVALKRILDEFADNGDLRRRFLREAEITGNLEHPGIVPVYGLGAHPDGRPYYAMRFIKGESMKDAIARAREPNDLARVPGQRELLGRFVAVCNAVAYAHARGLIHRDLKPANIMLGEYGETFVVDWGLARSIEDAEEPLPVSPDGRPDVTRGAIGTPAFMSPEQADGPPAVVGVASDVYSLGATLYTVLTGRPPLEGASLDVILAAARRGDFPPPRERERSVPLDIQAVCLKAMALRPEHRYASARDLAADVERFLADEPVTARREPRPEWLRRFLKRHRTLTLSAGALLLVTTLVLAVALARVSEANRAEREATADAESSAEKARRQRDEADAQRGKADLARKEADAARVAAEQAARRERRERYATNVSLAHQAWQAGRATQARRLLRDLLPRAGQEDLRGFEWRYLWRLCHEGMPRASQPHTGGVASAAFTPDGKRVVTAGDDGCVLLWDAESGQPLRSFVADPDDRAGELGVEWVVRNGRVVVSSIHPLGPAALDGRLRPDDEVVSLGGQGGITGPDQARGLEAGPAGSAVTIEARRRGRAFRLTLLRRHVLRAAAGDRPAARAALTPDGGTLVTAVGNVIRLWDVSTGLPLHTFRRPEGATAHSLALSPDGRRVATGEAGVIRLWDVERRHPAGAITYQFSAPGEESYAAKVLGLAFSADGKALLAGAGSAVLFCDPERRAILDTAPQPENGVVAIAGHPEGKEWLLGGQAARDNLELWDPATRQRESYLHGHAGAVRAVAFAPDGQGAFSGGTDGVPRLWDRETGRVRRLFHGHERSVTALACSPDGNALATGDASGVVLLHDVHRDADADSAPARSQDAPGDLAFAPDGRALFACGGERVDWAAYVGAWDAWSLAFRGLAQGPPPELGAVTFSPDGERLLVAESPIPDRFLPGVCRAYDVASGKEVGRFAGHEVGVFGVAAPASGDVVTSEIGQLGTRRRGEVIFWDPRTRLPLHRARPHAGMIGLALSPDGKTLLTHGFDFFARDRRGEVLLWDVATRSVRARVEGDLAQTTSAALSPDGALLVTATADVLRGDLPSPVQVWDAATGKPLTALTGHEGLVEPVAFAPDGKSVWLGNLDRGIRVHDPRSGKLVRALPPYPGLVNHFAFAPGGQRVAVAVGRVVSEKRRRPSFVAVLDAGSAKEQARFEVPFSLSPRVAFSPDGKRLAVSSDAGDLVVIDLDTKRQRAFAPDPELAQPNRHAAPVERLAVSPDGKTLATGGRDGRVKLWDIRPAAERVPARVRQTIPAGGVVSCLAFAPDGKTLAWGTGSVAAKLSGGLTLYDVAAGRKRAEMPVDPAGVTAVAFSPDGGTLAAATDHYSRGAGVSELWLLSVSTGAVSQVVRRGRFYTHDLAFSPDGTKLAFEQAASLELLDLPSGESIRLPGQARLFTRFAFAPDGKTLASANDDGTLKLWHVATGRELLSLPHGEPVKSLAFSRDGRALATGSKADLRGVIRLWRAGPVALATRTWYAEPGDRVAQRRVEYDEAGHVTEEAFFDEAGAPSVGPDGYHRYTSRPKPRYEDAKGQEVSPR